MKHWSLDDIPWDRFEPGKVDPDVLKIVKAASMVEHNGRAYGAYLSVVFGDDPDFKTAAFAWAEEEVQHGKALARWATLADPSFDFDARFERFAEAIKLPVGVADSVRGSRSGELVARCMVEVGTSSYYSALGSATEEPVLREICKRIAADELRHYKLFYSHLKRYVDRERTSLWRRLFVASRRIVETEDDELAYAYYAANEDPAVPYNRKIYTRAYGERAARFYRFGHVEQAVAMILKAVGLRPNGWLNRALSRVAYWAVHQRAQRALAAA